MADGALNFVLEKLTNILLQKASLLGDAHSDIDEIKLELESMKSFLRDAERRKERSEAVETWVNQVREVAYEVEDIVDEFMHSKDHKWGNRNGLKNIVQGIVNLPTRVAARHRIGLKLQKVKRKVHEVSERSKRYCFDVIEEGKHTNRGTERWQQYRDLSIFVDEDEIVGMGENMEKLLQWLMEDDERRIVISIVGMGGLGKTTLVTKVYNDQIIKRHFDCCGWVSVNQAYGVEELLVSMIREFSNEDQLMLPSNLGSMKYKQLAGMLIDYLRQKRYVIVLDDVWSIYLWSKIRGAFPNNRYGSRVILTTRNENVATSVGIGSRVHRLQPLQHTDAWALFCKKAFWNHLDRSCPKKLEATAQIILNKCEGLPLAIVAVGGLMSSREETIVEWERVCRSLNWHLNDDPMLQQIKAILLMSFNDLPFHLKHCFLYCCVFQDGNSIKRKKLIRLWIAEGFITERKGMTMEEVAEVYLKELIFRSMVQVTDTNENGRVKTCRVHDVMRELALTTSEKENFCRAYDGQESVPEGKTRRISVYNRGRNIQFSKSTLSHLRSFFVIETEMHPSCSLNAYFSNFRLLRVLDLQGVTVETIPNVLVKLFNLRYMNLRETKIRGLPKSLERLKNLQTLDLRNTYVKRLPKGTSELSELRHLYMYTRDDQKVGAYDLPSSVKAPERIWNARNLQTLTCIEAEEELLEQLGNLTELRRLEITKLKAVNGPILCTSIEKMKSLLRLGIMASSEEEELHLEAMHLPPFLLQKLTLTGKLIGLPPWFWLLQNLTHLNLNCSWLDEDICASLQALQTLAFLQLRKAYNGTCLHFKAGWFPRLNKLRLIELVRLDCVRLEEGALPSIRELFLIRCPQLKALPEGIEHVAVAGLQKLQLEEMPEELVHKLRTEGSEDRVSIQHIATTNLVFFAEQTRVVETL